MYSSTIEHGPGPTQVQTDFSQARTFIVPKGSFVSITPTFNTTWVSYIYIYDTGNLAIVGELSNDNNDPNEWHSGENVQDHDIEYGVVNYHKVNISPGSENANDDFFQGSLAKNTEQNLGNSLLITAGFSDGHGRDDNAVANINISLHP